MIFRKRVLSEKGLSAEANLYQRKIAATLDLMVGPDGHTYLDTYMAPVAIRWVSDNWFTDWVNAHHRATLQAPSREKVEALKKLNRQLFGRYFWHDFKRKIFEIRRWWYAHF